MIREQDNYTLIFILILISISLVCYIINRIFSNMAKSHDHVNNDDINVHINNDDHTD